MTPGPGGYPPRPPPPYPPAPYYPPPPYGYGYPSPYGAPPATDHRAVASLALGILSLTCGGLFLGVPAILFGFTARKHIERSGGAASGSGMALGGIITGFLGTALSLIVLVAFGVSLAMPPRGTAVAKPSHHVTPGVAHRATIGKVDVVQLSTTEGTLRDQLASELARARGAKKILLVQTTATWCTACDEIDAALPDARMQGALTNVELVRIDVDEFHAELMLQHMFEKTVPWFYKVDSTARPTDAISADEWDENIAENIAPILKAFAEGTLTKRRNATQIGTPL